MSDTTVIANGAAPATVTSEATKSDKKAKAMAEMSQTKGKAKQGGTAAKRLPIGEGDSVTRGIEVLGDRVVKASYTFKLSDADKMRYGVVTTFDYSDCTMAEILEMATRPNVITLQRNLRQMGDNALDATIYQNVNVKRDLIEAQRSTTDGETRDVHAFARAAKISPDVARQYLAAIANGTLKLK